MFPYGMLAKPGPSWRERIMRVLNGRIVVGRAAILTELCPNGFSPEENRQFNWALNSLISADEVAERRIQIPGTENFPAFEYTYRLRGTSPGYPRDLRAKK